MEIEGVKVDAPALIAELADAPPQVYSQANEAISNIRYRLYVEAMMGLDNVRKQPGLTDKQKKLIGQVIDQLKQVNAKAPSQPNQ